MLLLCLLLLLVHYLTHCCMSDYITLLLTVCCLQVNANDNDGGILYGRWSEPYVHSVWHMSYMAGQHIQCK